MVSPELVMQVCDPDNVTSCAWVPVSELTSFPVLSVEDAMILSSAVWGLFALVWVLKQLRKQAV